MQQRFLTDDEINDARAMVGWQFWAAPIMFGVASLGLGIGALGGDPVVIFLFLLLASLGVILWIIRLRDYNKVTRDIEMRIVEVVEDAPEKVWMPRSTIELTKVGFCYLRLAGRTIRVPNDSYGELREANMVKIAFLPTALVAVRVEPVRGIGGSSSATALPRSVRSLRREYDDEALFTSVGVSVRPFRLSHAERNKDSGSVGLGGT